MSSRALYEGLFDHTHDVCLELSNLCNLADVHHRCPVHTLQHERNVLPARIVHDVLGTLARHDFAGRIAFHTYNEPLLDPRLFEFIRLARSLCPDSNINICTNGFGLTQNMVHELVSAGVSSFHISAYSTADKERFSSMSFPVEASVELMTLDGRLDLYEAPENSSHGPCYAPLSEIIVTARGKVGLCCLDWKREYCFGDLNVQSLEQVMDGQEFRKAYARLAAGDRYLPLCRRCGWCRGNGEHARRGRARYTQNIPTPMTTVSPNGSRVTIDIMQDLAEFTGLGGSEIERLVRRYGYTARDEFREVISREHSDFWFYIASRYFLFENAVHSQTIDEAVKKLIPEGGRVWEFGGGTGNISLTLAAQGYDVSYTELSSLQKDFVAFRSHKYSLPIGIIHSWQPKPVGRFDLVLALDVLEHIEEYDKTLHELCDSVKPGGMMWETSAFLKDPANLTHHIPDVHDYRKLLDSGGFERVYGCKAGRLWRKTATRERQSLDEQTLRDISASAAGILADNGCDESLSREVMRGLEETARGNFALALDYFEEAWSMKNGIASPRLFALISAMAGGKRQQLQDMLHGIVTVEPDRDHTFLTGLGNYIMAVGLAREGMALLTGGDPGKAIEKLDAASSLCDAIAGMNYARAVALIQTGRLGSARCACERELLIQPGHRPTTELMTKIDLVLRSTELSNSKNANSVSTVR
jgi:GTP 3',8-cyclase